MAKSRRKKKIEAQNQKEFRQVIIGIGVVTIILLLVGYLMFSNS